MCRSFLLRFYEPFHFCVAPTDGPAVTQSHNLYLRLLSASNLHLCNCIQIQTQSVLCGLNQIATINSLEILEKMEKNPP